MRNPAERQEPQSVSDLPPAGRRRWWFRLLAIALGLLPFVLLEAGLRLADVARPQNSADPFVGFSAIHPLFELDECGETYVTSKSRELYFVSQRFAAKKSSEEFRAFCLGGSTVQGRPYSTDTAFGKWLELELDGIDPARTHQVVNCGGLSYASYRLRPILDEVLGYAPDLIIIATGHNEFLEDRTYHDLKSRSAVTAWITDRLYSLRTVTWARDALSDETQGRRDVLPEEVAARLDNRSGYASYHWDEAWRADVINHFEHSVRTMVAMCREAGVPLILVNLGSNLRDCPPFKSEHRPGLKPLEERKWQQLFEAAEQAETEDLDRALELYQAAEEIDDGFALLLYRTARCLDRLGRPEEAREYYLKAKDRDVCPLRILEEVDRRLKQVARETNTPLVPARKLLEQRSLDGIPGYNLYIDHVHPTIGAHQWIAQAIAEVWQEQNPTTDAAAARWNDEARRAAYLRHWRELPAGYLANGRRRVGWLENWARRQRLYEETLPKDARGFVRLGHRRLDFDDRDEAWAAYEAALELDPQVAPRLVVHARRLFDQGRPDAAKFLLDRLESSPAGKRIGEELAVAAFVVAVEQGNLERAAMIRAQQDGSFEPATRDSSAWRDVLEEALQRIEKPSE